MPAREVVLVTGSSGFVGAPLVRALASDGTVVGFDRAGDPHPPVEAECVCVDLTSSDSVDAGLARVRYAYGDRLASVVHLAAYYDLSGAPSTQYDAVTAGGVQHLIADALHGEQWRTLRVPKALAKAGAWLQDTVPLVGDPFLRPSMVDRTSDHYALDTTTARSLLGCRAKHSLRHDIAVIAAALKDDPAAWYRANGLEPPRRGRR